MSTSKSAVRVAFAWLAIGSQLGASAFAAAPGGDHTGLRWVSPDANAAKWNEFCSAPGGAASSDVPSPRYFKDGQGTKVLKAAVKFNGIADQSIYLYGAITGAYGAKKAEIPAEAAQAGVNKNAHAFMIYLCGEFRDRASMIEAKLDWLLKLNKLKSSPQQPPVKPGQDVWSAMVAQSYHPFIDFSRALWNARKKDPRYSKIVDLGTSKTTGQNYKEPMMVPGLSVCETRHIFNSYLAAGPTPASKKFTNLQEFDASYAAFKSSGNCAEADLTDYYDFRGDSNFKPNSPEANGMIWYALGVASHCKDTKNIKDKPITGENITNKANLVTSQDCDDYFKNPFRRRWEAARAGLSTWMARNQKVDPQFAPDDETVVLWVHRIKDENSKSKSPFGFKFSFSKDEAPQYFWLDKYDTAKAFHLADLDFNLASGLGTENVDTAFAFERLRDAVNRHTNWYQSGWDDGLDAHNNQGSSISQREQAYSPFVASSYEPSSSDAFTHCGITVPCPPDGFKHWMFVFRIKGQNVYGVENVLDRGPADGIVGKKVNFATQWLDETSLGTTGLANSEHAWDRLGTAMEEELSGGAILYLHNISDDGQVTGDSLPAIN
jgi:hypothetical protein